MQRHRPRHFVNREGRPRGLVRCKGWSRDIRREGWSRDLGHEGRCRDIGPGTSSIVKVGPWAWSDVKVAPETRDRDALFSTCTLYSLQSSYMQCVWTFLSSDVKICLHLIFLRLCSGLLDPFDIASLPL